MKSPTPHYRSLCRSLRKARSIASRVDKLGCNSDLQHLKLQAYILLCHAALEQYLEQLSLDAALKARQKFKNSGIITKTLVALISSKLANDLSEKSKAKLTLDLVSNIEQFSIEAFSRYNDLVATNHGIVKKDQIKLLVPVGVNPSEIDIVLFNNLDSFGKLRGEVAHSFKVIRVNTLTDIDTRIKSIKTDILLYDQAVCNTLKSKMT